MNIQNDLHRLNNLNMANTLDLLNPEPKRDEEDD